MCCPARGKDCFRCLQKHHFARCCLSQQHPAGEQIRLQSSKDVSTGGDTVNRGTNISDFPFTDIANQELSNTLKSSHMHVENQSLRSKLKHFNKNAKSGKHVRSIDVNTIVSGEEYSYKIAKLEAEIEKLKLENQKLKLELETKCQSEKLNLKSLENQTSKTTELEQKNKILAKDLSEVRVKVKSLQEFCDQNEKERSKLQEKQKDSLQTISLLESQVSTHVKNIEKLKEEVKDVQKRFVMTYEDMSRFLQVIRRAAQQIHWYESAYNSQQGVYLRKSRTRCSEGNCKNCLDHCAGCLRLIHQHSGNSCVECGKKTERCMVCETDELRLEFKYDETTQFVPYC